MRSQTLGICLSAFVVFAAAQAQCEEKIHELKASPTTVHRGFFDASLKPVLTIDSGDIVRLWTTTGNPRYFESLGVPKEKIPAELYAAFEGAPGEGRDDHTLDGPIAVRGAEPGDTVEIRIRSIDLWLPIAAMSFRGKPRLAARRVSLLAGPRLLSRSRQRRPSNSLPAWSSRPSRSGASSVSRRRLRWVECRAARPTSSAATWTTTICNPEPACTCRSMLAAH